MNQNGYGGKGKKSSHISSKLVSKVGERQQQFSFKGFSIYHQPQRHFDSTSSARMNENRLIASPVHQGVLIVKFLFS
jgi:hypothetical protein